MQKIYLFFIFLAAVKGQRQITEKELQRWDGLTQFTSTQGFACVSPCVAKTLEIDHWCYVREGNSGVHNEHGHLDYCSPSPTEDYQGNQCRGPCTYDNFSKRFLCPTIHGYHNFCGRTIDSIDVGVVGQVKTVRGDYCVSPCQKQGNSSNWCYKADRSYDHCSPQPGFDINGAKCLSRCDFHGRNYTWCRIEGGGWNYCSTTTVSSETEFTFIGSKCVTPCIGYTDGFNRCWDGTEENRECSRVTGLTTQNRVCGTNTCHMGDGSIDLSYFWCPRYNDDGYDFCSNVRPDPRETEEGLVESTQRRWKERKYFPKALIDLKWTKTRERSNIFYLRDELGSNKVTFYEAVAATPLRTHKLDPKWLEADIQEMVRYCLNLWRISKYPIGSGPNLSRVLLVKAGRQGLRLEQQSRYRRNGGDYVTLQLRKAGNSTNIGEVQTPVGVLEENGEEIVGAMLKSVYGGWPVYIARFSYRSR